MKFDIQDNRALLAVPPVALSSYARAAGWKKIESYGKHSDIYAADQKPEIVVPKADHLGDYASVVAQLIKIFAEVADRDEISLYLDLMTRDQDIIRIRVTERDEGRLSLGDWVELIGGARDMVLAAACSLKSPEPLYRAGANREAMDLLSRVRLGQTERSGFVVTLLMPKISPPIQSLLSDLDGREDLDAPEERQVTRRLIAALNVTRDSVERTVAGDLSAFVGTVGQGVSVNLCGALVRLIGRFSTVEIEVTWARTRAMKCPRASVHFSRSDTAILSEAGRLLREREPQPEVNLIGMVQNLPHDDARNDGIIAVRTSVDGNNVLVFVMLKQSDLEQAVLAHKKKTPVVLRGDLERAGQRWRLLNSRLVDVIAEGVG